MFESRQQRTRSGISAASGNISTCSGMVGAGKDLFRVDSECQDLEVTHEDHIQRVKDKQRKSSNTTAPSPKRRGSETSQHNNNLAATNNNISSNNNNNNNTHATGAGGVAQRISNMLMRPRNQNQQQQTSSSSPPAQHTSSSSSGQARTRSSASRNRRAVANNGDASFCSDHATTTSDHGSRCNASVTNSNFTVASNDTVKASNKSEPSNSSHSMDEEGILRFRKRWSKFKTLVGAGAGAAASCTKTIPEEGSDAAIVPRQYSYSADFLWTNKTSPAARERLCSAPDDTPPTTTKRSRSNPHSNVSSPHHTNNNTISGNNNQQQQSMNDQSIRCRLDGVDCLSIGPPHPSHILPWLPAFYELAQEQQSKQQQNNNNDNSSNSNFVSTFTGKHLDPTFTKTPADMVSNMLWTSCGRDLPEIILDGFLPGCDDRWTVRVEEKQDAIVSSLSSSSSFASSTHPLSTFNRFVKSVTTVPGCTDESFSPDPPKTNNNNTNMTHTNPTTMHHGGSHLTTGGTTTTTATSTTANTTTSRSSFENDDLLLHRPPSEDGSSTLPTHRLWHKLWGQDPKPVSASSISPVDDDDPLLSLAAEYSIPIDLDENTFCVSERNHLDTIHTFVAVCLSMGRFQSAIKILKKLLKGIDLIKEEDLRFLKGSTLHNIGIIYMWEGDFDNALEYFHIAVQERTKVLPKDHPDIVVSLIRKGQAQFALGRFEDALFVMELALPMTPPDHIVRSKLWTNMGVIHFCNNNPTLAMKEFTSSLEIARVWLESSIRRDVIIHDASTTLSNMGRLYIERLDFDLAYYVYEEALLLQTTAYRKGHDLVLSSLTSLALCRARQDKVKKALQLLQGCLRSKNARFGRDSPEAIETLAMMGLFYQHLNIMDDALKCFLTVRKWQKAHLPSNHPSLQQTKQIVDAMEETMGKSNLSIWV